VAKNLVTHFGQATFRVFGPAYESLLHGGATLLILWLILWWMYRRKIFLKI
jgi:predicted acyltransferase